MDSTVDAELEALAARLSAAHPYNIGFPGATDFDYTALSALLAQSLLNNVGDPYVDGVATNHTKAMERDVVGFVADLLRAPAHDRWGYIASGGSEGNLYGLYLARGLYPDAVVYYSAQAHPSIAKAVDLLALPSVVVRADPSGEMDYTDLTRQVEARRDKAAIVAATIGTTMAEAVDDVRRISAILDTLVVRRRFVHADAALSGIPLALLATNERPGFDFADGADCVTVSGHKFLGCPTPCAVVVTRASLRDRLAASVVYTASPDTTIGGSRSGHTPLMLWYTIRRHGVDGLRHRADTSRALAAYTVDQLAEIGWPAARNPHAFTVVLKSPPEAVLKKWVLASDSGHSHIITMPGVTQVSVDAFLADLRAALPSADCADSAGGDPRPDRPYSVSLSAGQLD